MENPEPCEQSDEDASEVADGTTVLPAEQPLTHRYCENSYFSGGIRRQYKEHWIVNYQRCSLPELKRFVIDRHIPDPFSQGVTLKYFYIRLLERADREWSFRFMDLPPEMRLHVYRPLLITQERPGRKDMVHPEILCTSKQVNREAQSILYNENVFTIGYRASIIADKRSRSVNILGVTTRADCPHGEFFRLPHAIDHYPQFLQRVSQMRITLSSSLIMPDSSEPQTDIWDLNNYLYGLSSFLMENHSLKILHLEILSWTEDKMTLDIFEKVLYPLRRIRNVPTVIVCNAIPPQLARKLRKYLRSLEPAFNTLRLWKYLEKEGQATTDLYSLLTERACEDFAELYDDDFDDGITTVGLARFDLGLAARKSCSGSHMEERFMAMLSRLDNGLAQIDLTELTAVLTRIKRGRIERRQYLASTDDRRLDEAWELWTENMEFPDVPPMYITEDEWSDIDDEDEDDGHEVDEANGLSEMEGDVEDMPQHPMMNSDQIEAVFDVWQSDTSMVDAGHETSQDGSE